MKVQIWYGTGHLPDTIIPVDEDSVMLFNHIFQTNKCIFARDENFEYLKKMAKLHGEELEITDPRGTKRD
jgi:hypothetical protein